MNPETRAKLDSLPQVSHYNPIWPKGTKQPLTKALIAYFCSLVSTCDTSLVQLLRNHPELPHFSKIDSWRATNKYGFADAWKAARISQAHFLANKCLQLATEATPKTAHVVRVQFDIYRWFAAKMHPLLYGDKPALPSASTTVNVGINISPERLHDIRSKLDQTRVAMLTKTAREKRDVALLKEPATSP